MSASKEAMTIAELRLRTRQETDDQRAVYVGDGRWSCFLHDQPTRNLSPRARHSVHALPCSACLQDIELELATEKAAAEGAAFGNTAAEALRPIVDRLDRIVSLLEGKKD